MCCWYSFCFLTLMAYDLNEESPLAARISQMLQRPAPKNDTASYSTEWLEMRTLLEAVSQAAGPTRRPRPLKAHFDDRNDKAAAVSGSAVAVACGDCYGAQHFEGQCCDTCNEVRGAYAARGWHLDESGVVQCRAEASGAPVCEMDSGGSDGTDDVVKRCAPFLSCASCVAEDGCAWCISHRACRPDQPWYCQGDVDHIGRAGVGQHVECPSLEAVDAESDARSQAVRVLSVRNGKPGLEVLQEVLSQLASAKELLKQYEQQGGSAARPSSSTARCGSKGSQAVQLARGSRSCTSLRFRRSR